jgi:hypothetical protein
MELVVLDVGLDRRHGRGGFFLGFGLLKLFNKKCFVV